MTWLKYYEEERQRLPEMHATRCSPGEAQEAIRRMARHFKVPVRTVEFTSGHRSSRAFGSYRIVFNAEALSWRLVAHEFAHCWHSVDRRARVQRAGGPLTPRGQRIEKERAHGKRHAKLVDRAVAYIVKKGWHAGVLQAKQNELATRRAARAAKLATPPTLEERQVLREKRIAKREEQAARLERRIKSLTTRLKKARRSIGALRRAQAKDGERIAASKGPPS
jgi:hypothetical protein